MKFSLRSLSTLFFLLFMLARLPGQYLLTDADIAIVKKDYRQALVICNSLQKSGDNSAAVDLRLGIIYSSLSDYTRALEHLQRAEEGGEKNISTGLLIADCHEAIGDIDAASLKYEEIIYADRSNLYPVINYSKLLLTNRLYDKALKWCQLLVDSMPDNPVLRKNLGGCFLQLSMDPEALYHLHEAWTLNNKDLSLLTAMTTAWLRLKIPKNGLKTLAQAIEVHPESPVPHKCIGNLQFALQAYDSSAVAYQMAFDLGDTSVYIARQAGLSYYAINKFSQAVPFLRINYEYDTLNYEAVQYLGLALANSSRQREAIPYLENAVSLLHPDSALIGNLYASIGRAAFEINNFSKAISEYHQALRYLPKNQDYRFELARVYDQNKNYKEALKYYGEYLDNQNRLVMEIAESRNIDPEKISLGPRHTAAKQRVKKIQEELFFMGEIQRFNS